MLRQIAVAAALCVTLAACAQKPEVVARPAAKPSYAPSQLMAGTAKVEITPQQAVISAEGEGFRLPDNPTDRPPQNVHDPLYARVLVLKNNNSSIAIVSADVLFFASKHVIAEAKKKFGIDHVLLCPTFTHTGMLARGLCPTDGGYGWYFKPEDPAVLINWPGLSEDPWYAATEAKVIEAIGTAASNMFPARVVAGQGPYKSDYMAHNRRLVLPDGTVEMMWANPDKIATKPIDPTVRMIRVDDLNGKPRAFAVHFACHPVIVMGPEAISRDFPGATVDYIEEKLGDSCMAMFLQGAMGDIDPYETALRGAQGFDFVKKAGVSLAEAALSVSATLPAAAAPEKTYMRAKELLLDIPHRTAGKSSKVGVATVVINDKLALVSIPGSPFIQHQLNLSEKSPAATTLLLGAAYSGQGSEFISYIPTVQAAKEGGRGAADCTFVAPDAGEKMVDAAVTSITNLMEKSK